MKEIVYGTVLAALLVLSPIRHAQWYGGVIGTKGLPPSTNPCLVSGWPMNEGSGLTLHDASGNANNATISSGGAVTWQSNSGFPGTTPYWNTSGYALATSTSVTNFTGSTPFSLAAWVNPDNQTASEWAMVGTLNAISGTYQGWELSFNYQGASTLWPHFFLINTYPSNAIDVVAETPISGVSYIVATYDGSQLSSGVKIYVNGTSETTTVNLNSLTGTAANGLPVTIAARNNGTDKLQGVLAFSEVYNCVLTPTQISTYYAAGPGLY